MKAKGQVPGLWHFSILPPGCSTSRVIGTHHSSCSSYGPFKFVTKNSNPTNAVVQKLTCHAGTQILIKAISIPEQNINFQSNKKK
jgi:hypothetical protein